MSDTPTEPGPVETFVHALREAGSEAVFSVPGGGVNLAIGEAAVEAGMQYVLMHGETAACIAAGVSGKVRGGVELASVTRGPGAASAANGAAQSTLDRFPLVLACDTVQQDQRHRVRHQLVDQQALFAPVTKATGVLGRQMDGRRFAEACDEHARGWPPGAVYVEVDASAPGALPSPPEEVVATPLPIDAAHRLDEALDLVRRARRPVWLVGIGALEWAGELRSLLADTPCPVLTTYQAKGLVPDTWPQTGPPFTNGRPEHDLLERADVICAIGLDPVEPRGGPWPYRAPVVTMSPQPLDSAYFGATVDLVGSPAEVLHPLVDAARDADWHGAEGEDAREGLRRAVREATGAHAAGNGGRGSGAAPAGAGLAPQRVVDVVAAATGPRSRITVDAGAHMLAVMPLVEAHEPLDVLISNGLSTMGFALPAAIGAARAEPERPVVCFTGDGGLGMCLAELETLARLQLNVTVAVLNDRKLSLIDVKASPRAAGLRLADYSEMAFARVAEGCGVPATTVDRESGLVDAVSGGPAGPRLLDVRVDPAHYRDIMDASR
ncbi:thiamine pyrophosphate-binding protein [Egibacter rhizosphaerae]|uniref:Thiamine pyrophosphate-binding protein n=1 Tax=Egibacter rhizosphaerae TaxID=1670831 RepID=A0A411YF97_9ACTN|nr:thiamine pyrophosphate-dependent enzyme [Egibacter rhizosphaerae]QBI19900.1 thiamine pyrophosphate-binding protein [Egibacter rhizosphaerae]